MSVSAELTVGLTYAGGSASRDRTFAFAPSPPPPPPAPVGVRVELYLLDAAGSPNWVDVTGPFTRSYYTGTDGHPILIEGIMDSGAVTVRRTCSQQDQYFRYDGGSCTFTLRNLHGAWDPLNLSGPWVVDGKSLLKQGPKGTGVRVQIQEPGSGLVHDVFNGVVSSWPVSYRGNLYSDVTVTAQDGVAQLKGTNLGPLNAASYAGQSAGQRIDVAAVWAGWFNPHDDVDITRINSMQPTVFKSDAWSEMQLTAESDSGFLWLNKLNGRTYRTRYHTIDATPTLTFSMNQETGTHTYVMPGPTNSTDLSSTWNVVNLTREGGIVQTAMTDDAAENGYVSVDRSGLLMQSDEQVMDTALFDVGTGRNTVFRPTDIPVELTPHDEKWADCLAAEIFDTTEVRQVTPSPPGVAARTITSRVVNTGFTWKLQTGTGKASLLINTAAAPPTYGPFYYDDAAATYDDADVVYAY